MPLFMIMGSVGLVGLFYAWPPWAPAAFTVLWSVTFASYLFQTLFSFAIDPATAKRCWFEGIAFPGLLSLGVMMMAVLGLKPFAGLRGVAAARQLVLARRRRAGRPWLVGHLHLPRLGGLPPRQGRRCPRACATSCWCWSATARCCAPSRSAAIIAQFRNADLKWDKTIKSGKARLPT